MNKYWKRSDVCIWGFFACVFLSLIGGSICEAAAQKVSRPFEYEGYSSPEYKNFNSFSEYVSMFDGTKIAVKVYLPSEGPSAASFPVIFTYTPYHQESLNPATGERIAYFSKEAINFFTSYGYAIVCAGMRGSSASYGSKLENSPQLAKDGKQLVDWIEAQPWCDGNVGMAGLSYFGWSQYATAGQKPAALKCIIPEEIYFEAFTSPLFYPGGIGNKAVWEILNMGLAGGDQNFHIPAMGVFPSAPVVDEDGDGDLTDEIPVDLNKNGNFLDDYQWPDKPPQYSDGKVRKHIYYHATLEHLKNPYYTWVPKAPFRDSNIPGFENGYSDLGPSDWLVHMIDSGIAVYNIGGWFDAYTNSTVQWYATLKATNPSRMLLVPSIHETFGILRRPPGPYWGHFGIDAEEMHKGYNNERLRFFDRYLKRIENGIDKEPSVCIYVMNGEGWRTESEWPLSRQVMTNYYFSEGGILTKEGGSEGSDIYRVDFTHDARQDLSSRWNPIPPKEVWTRTDKDAKCLTYTSHLLEEDTEVTGHPIVHFWVSSTAEDGDFFIYLEDVDKKGEAFYVTDGLLRANYAGLVPNEDILPPGANIDILPDLPWHGFKKADYVDGIFAGKNVVELVIDMRPISWVFKKGRRIRISIACADWPSFQLHPKLSPANDPGDPKNIVPTITVYRDAQHPSSIELPIIPPKA